jgi:hypothetical protein
LVLFPLGIKVSSAFAVEEKPPAFEDWAVPVPELVQAPD